MPKKATTAVVSPAKMEALVQQKGGDLIPYRIGNVVECIVLHATSKVIYVDIGGIAMGVIPEREMSTLPKSLHPGDTIHASVISLEDYKGNMVLSMRRADRDRILGQLTSSHEDGEQVDVIVADANKGGLLINVGDFTGFLPVSQLASRHYPKVDGGNTDEIFAKLKDLIGQTLQVKVITFEPKAGKLIFSEKAAGDKEQEERIKGIGVGDTMEGTISGIVDFGLFVQLNNEGKELEGLIHISEVAWGRVANLDDRFEIGQKVKALVVSTEDNRVSLSLKRLTPDPWKDIEERYKIGDVVAGSVTRITPFGVFVKLDDEIDGLVHVSELSDERVNDPADILSPAKTYNFKVISVEPKKHRLGLSYKQAAGEKPGKKAAAKKTKEVAVETPETPKVEVKPAKKAVAKKPAAKKETATKKPAAKKAVKKTASEPQE
jgi:small subunit ribosomal protein S1